MGRGRQKAKQTKVARELKYHTASIDVTALQRELSGGLDAPDFEDRYSDEGGADSDDDDPYAVYADEDDDEASDYASQSRRR
jgi:hypothetical protein